MNFWCFLFYYQLLAIHIHYFVKYIFYEIDLTKVIKYFIEKKIFEKNTKIVKLDNLFYEDFDDSKKIIINAQLIKAFTKEFKFESNDLSKMSEFAKGILIKRMLFKVASHYFAILRYLENKTGNSF
jgi:competence CoiA-like predicted nuclease